MLPLGIPLNPAGAQKPSAGRSEFQSTKQLSGNDVARFTHHIFVCSNRRSCDHPRGCCDPEGGDQLRGALKAELKKRGMTPAVRANSAGCLDQCELGPVVVVYPQAVWYGGVSKDDVGRLVDAIENDEILEDLLIADEMLNTKGRGPGGPRSDASSSNVSDEQTSEQASDSSRRRNASSPKDGEPGT